MYKDRGRVKSINLLRSTVYIYRLDATKLNIFKYITLSSHCLLKETGQRARTGQCRSQIKSLSPELQPPHTSHHQSSKHTIKTSRPGGIFQHENRKSLTMLSPKKQHYKRNLVRTVNNTFSALWKLAENTQRTRLLVKQLG